MPICTPPEWLVSSPSCLQHCRKPAHTFRLPYETRPPPPCIIYSLLYETVVDLAYASKGPGAALRAARRHGAARARLGLPRWACGALEHKTAATLGLSSSFHTYLLAIAEPSLKSLWWPQGQVCCLVEGLCTATHTGGIGQYCVCEGSRVRSVGEGRGREDVCRLSSRCNERVSGTEHVVARGRVA